jgi:hypothetical protein
LRGRLRKQDTWEQGLIWKMATQKRFIPAHRVFSRAATPRLKAEQPLDKPEFGSVR